MTSVLMSVVEICSSGTIAAATVAAAHRRAAFLLCAFLRMTKNNTELITRRHMRPILDRIIISGHEEGCWSVVVAVAGAVLVGVSFSFSTTGTVTSTFDSSACRLVSGFCSVVGFLVITLEAKFHFVLGRDGCTWRLLSDMSHLVPCAESSATKVTDTRDSFPSMETIAANAYSSRGVLIIF